MLASASFTLFFWSNSGSRATSTLSVLLAPPQRLQYCTVTARRSPRVGAPVVPHAASATAVGATPVTAKRRRVISVGGLILLSFGGCGSASLALHEPRELDGARLERAQDAAVDEAHAHANVALAVALVGNHAGGAARCCDLLDRPVDRRLHLRVLRVADVPQRLSQVGG